MRKKPRKTTTVEIGNATVFVTRASLDLDRQGRGYYRCDVHPVGGPFFRCFLRAKSRQEAATLAMKEYEIGDKKNLPDKF